MCRAKIAALGIKADQIGHGRTDIEHIRREAEQLLVARIPRDKVLLGIDDADARIDIFERRRQQCARKAQRLAALVQQAGDFGEAHRAARQRRGDQRTRRRCADHRRDQLTRALGSAPIDRGASTRAEKFALGPLAPDEAGCQIKQILHIEHLALPTLEARQ